MHRRFFSILLILAGIATGLPRIAPLSEARARQQAAPSATPILPQAQLNQLSSEAQGWLADLIRIDTTNPPGNELAAAKYVAAVLQKENIPVGVLEIAPGTRRGHCAIAGWAAARSVEGAAVGGASGCGRRG